MPFELEETPIEGLRLIRSRVFQDGRGFFLEAYKASDFHALGLAERFCQDNHSYSARGVLRGLHFQRAPRPQGKLVRAISGRIWDVAVDLRPESPTFRRWYGVELSGDDGKMLYVPPGFGHGFAALSDAHVSYKCTSEYDARLDGGLRWDDPEIAVAWPVADPILSPKDEALPLLQELVLPLV